MRGVGGGRGRGNFTQWELEILLGGFFYPVKGTWEEMILTIQTLLILNID